MKNILQHAFLKKRLGQVEAYLTDFLSDGPAFISEQASGNLSAGGKRLRPAFVIMSSEYYNRFDDNIIKVASMLELIHMSSLIHDDINDNADLRRGRQTIHTAFTNDVAAHVGDYILIKALRHLFEVPNHERILDLIADTAVEMCKGEIAQLNSMFDWKQSIADYNYRIERKTALLIAICCQMGAVMAEAGASDENAFYQYGYHLGMAFQMKDDLLDLLNSDAEVGKPTGKDLETGLINLPTILLLNKDFAEKEHVRHLISAQFPNGEKDVGYIVNLIKREGCFAETEKIILNHIQQAKDVLTQLEKKPITDLMRSGADFIYERAY